MGLDILNCLAGQGQQPHVQRSHGVSPEVETIDTQEPIPVTLQNFLPLYVLWPVVTKIRRIYTVQMGKVFPKAVVLQDDINGASSGLHLDQEIHPVCGMSVSWIDLTQISAKFELSIDFHKVT